MSYVVCHMWFLCFGVGVFAMAVERVCPFYWLHPKNLMCGNMNPWTFQTLEFYQHLIYGCSQEPE
ncbi:hypothetical protein M758_11G093500 [Ceratodon purpureus]|nr:hypothetical protein M758_11G093500 [Ceratodon purpureus]